MSDNINNIYEEKSIFNVGIVIFSMMLIMFLLLYSHGIISALMVLFICYIGAFFGNIVRIYAMPNMYFTSGSLYKLIKEKFFWSHLPQIIGYCIALFLIFIYENLY